MNSGKSDTYELFLKSYEMQIDELKGNVEHIDPVNVRKAIDIILACEGKVACTGMGKSGLIAQKLSATLSSTGTPAFFLHPGESLHGDLGALQKNDVMILMAKSGESDEVVMMLQVVQKIGIPIIAILGNPDSTAGRMATVIVRATVSREADPLNLAPTASTTVALVVGDALATTLAQIRDFRPEHFAMYHPAGQLGRRLLLAVEDLLGENRSLPVVRQDADMLTVLETESKPNLGGVMVVNESGRLVGILTDGDIRRAILKHRNVLDCKLSEIMTRDPITVREGTKALEALREMENRPSQISVMPVVDENHKPVGLLRLHDLLQAGL